MLAALILHTFQIVFSGHRGSDLVFTAFSRRAGLNFSRLLRADNAIHRRRFHRGRPEAPASNSNRREPKSAPQVLTLASSFIQSRRILMRSKLAISALVVASLFGATAIASAQTQPAPGASSEGNVGPGATPDTKMKSHKMKSSKIKSGTTTGMSAGSKKHEARKPSGQGTDDNAGKNTGSK
jgi:hypothetical protein